MDCDIARPARGPRGVFKEAGSNPKRGFVNRFQGLHVSGLVCFGMAVWMHVEWLAYMKLGVHVCGMYCWLYNMYPRCLLYMK
jgi:hypothetical protein